MYRCISTEHVWHDCCCFSQHPTQDKCWHIVAFWNLFSHLELTVMLTLRTCASGFGQYAGRMRFENQNPMQNSALLISSTEESDEGTYTCRISTFPYGNFDRHIELAVWSKSPSHFSHVALFLSCLSNHPIPPELLDWCLKCCHHCRRAANREKTRPINDFCQLGTRYWFTAGDTTLFEPDSIFIGVIWRPTSSPKVTYFIYLITRDTDLKLLTH